MAERMAINAPIQGTSADIIKIAMRRIDDFLMRGGYEEDAHLILQVHDELVYEIRSKKIDIILNKIKEIMENIIDKKDSKGIVFEVNSSIGKNWAELE